MRSSQEEGLRAPGWAGVTWGQGDPGGARGSVLGLPGRRRCLEWPPATFSLQTHRLSQTTLVRLATLRAAPGPEEQGPGGGRATLGWPRWAGGHLVGLTLREQAAGTQQLEQVLPRPEGTAAATQATEQALSVVQREEPNPSSLREPLDAHAVPGHPCPRSAWAGKPRWPTGSDLQPSTHRGSQGPQALWGLICSILGGWHSWEPAHQRARCRWA